MEGKGHTVETLYLNSEPEAECLERIFSVADEFDVIGLQVFAHNRACTFRVLERYPDRRVVIGGIHASTMYPGIIEKYRNVVAVIGEGEVTFAELVERGAGPDVNGIAYWDGERVARTPDRELIADLDTLPIPKHELFFSGGRTNANILTSRGCPYKCSFCTLDTTSRRKVRLRSPDSVIAEILHLKEICPDLMGIWIHDDSFLLDNARAIEICKRIAALKLGIALSCSARFKPLSAEVVGALESAGFVQVLFGLESGSEKILKAAHKGITRLDAMRAFELFRDSPIAVTAFLIVGLPGEDETTIRETVEFIHQLQKIKYTYYEDIGTLIVYPGTEVYEICKQAGAMTDDFWMTDEPVPLFTVEHPAEKLEGFKNAILDRIALKRQLRHTA